MRATRPRLRRDDIDGRRERAEQILRTAAGLIERWGFDKTTVDDIARAAGVAKGTIYLHWKTRDELFVALLRQERVSMLDDIRRRLADDAAAPIVRTVFRHFAAAMLRRPLLRAVVVNDQAVLGRLAAQRRQRPGDLVQRAGFAEYLALLQEHRAIRSDFSLREHVSVVSATFMGSLVTNSLMPEEYALTDEESADLIAETVHRTLGAARSLRETALLRATVGYVDNAQAIARQQLDAAIGLGGEADAREEDAR